MEDIAKIMDLARGIVLSLAYKVGNGPRLPRDGLKLSAVFAFAVELAATEKIRKMPKDWDLCGGQEKCLKDIDCAIMSVAGMSVFDPLFMDAIQYMFETMMAGDIRDRGTSNRFIEDVYQYRGNLLDLDGRFHYDVCVYGGEKYRQLPRISRGIVDKIAACIPLAAYLVAHPE